MDPDQRRRQRYRLAPPADLDPPRAPRVGALEVVDHYGGSSGAGDVTDLLRPLKVAPADVEGVAGRVVDPSDRDDVRGAVGPDRGEAAELAAAAEVLELGL